MADKRRKPKRSASKAGLSGKVPLMKITVKGTQSIKRVRPEDYAQDLSGKEGEAIEKLKIPARLPKKKTKFKISSVTKAFNRWMNKQSGKKGSRKSISEDRRPSSSQGRKGSRMSIHEDRRPSTSQARRESRMSISQERRPSAGQARRESRMSISQKRRPSTGKARRESRMSISQKRQPSTSQRKRGSRISVSKGRRRSSAKGKKGPSKVIRFQQQRGSSQQRRRPRPERRPSARTESLLKQIEEQVRRSSLYVRGEKPGKQKHDATSSDEKLINTTVKALLTAFGFGGGNELGESAEEPKKMEEDKRKQVELREEIQLKLKGTKGDEYEPLTMSVNPKKILSHDVKHVGPDTWELKIKTGSTAIDYDVATTSKEMAVSKLSGHPNLDVIAEALLSTLLSAQKKQEEESKLMSPADITPLIMFLNPQDILSHDVTKTGPDSWKISLVDKSLKHIGGIKSVRFFRTTEELRIDDHPRTRTLVRRPTPFPVDLLAQVQEGVEMLTGRHGLEDEIETAPKEKESMKTSAHPSFRSVARAVMGESGSKTLVKDSEDSEAIWQERQRNLKRIEVENAWRDIMQKLLAVSRSPRAGKPDVTGANEFRRQSLSETRKAPVRGRKRKRDVWIIKKHAIRRYMQEKSRKRTGTVTRINPDIFAHAQEALAYFVRDTIEKCRECPIHKSKRRMIVCPCAIKEALGKK